ncbi:MAG: ankyrin repeat domain-containing protein [Magnetococcales bacterium]|nr:ankyrin repeat domain-containing protein [Magnetococcales bacterium]
MSDIKKLFRAAAEGNVAQLKSLMASAQSLVDSLVDENGWTALHEAAYEGQLKTVQFLAEIGPVNVRDNLGRTPMHSAVARDNHAVMSLLRNHGANNAGFADL